MNPDAIHDKAIDDNNLDPSKVSGNSSEISNDYEHSADTSVAVHPPLSEGTVVALAGLGNILRKINSRLLAEGYILENGKLIKK